MVLLDVKNVRKVYTTRFGGNQVEAHIFKSVENVNIETVIAYKKDGVKHHFLDDYDLK